MREFSNTNLEYKSLSEIRKEAYKQGRIDAIDEFYNRLLDNKNEINASNYPWNYIELVARKLTEQLKDKNYEKEN